MSDELKGYIEGMTKYHNSCIEAIYEKQEVVNITGKYPKGCRSRAAKARYDDMLERKPERHIGALSILENLERFI